MAEITLPTNFIDWSTKQLNIPSNGHSKNHGNSTDRRKWPPLLLDDEPHYVIIRSDAHFVSLHFSSTYFPFLD